MARTILLLLLLALPAPCRGVEHTGTTDAAAADSVAFAASFVCKCKGWQVQACCSFTAAVLADVVAFL
jgi:hypothetical protein